MNFLVIAGLTAVLLLMLFVLLALIAAAWVQRREMKRAIPQVEVYDPAEAARRSRIDDPLATASSLYCWE